MNKIVGIAVLVGGLAYSIATGDIALAQGKYKPIKFGSDSKFTYQVSDNPLEPYSSSFTQTTIKQGESWGKVYIGKSGTFDMWGGLNGTRFHYSSDTTRRLLTLYKNNVEIEFYDVASDAIGTRGIGRDTASINGEYIDLRSRLFFEGQEEPRGELEQKLNRVFLDYNNFLNVNGVRAEAEKKKIPPEHLRKSLDMFVK